MAVYTVHEPPRRTDDTLAHTERFAFVRDGFSWSAFLLTPLWMLWRRLWLVLVAYLVLVGAIQFGLAAIGAAGWLRLVVHGLLSLLIGLEAASLRRLKLGRRGWNMVGVVVADDPEAAERRFFDAWTGDVISPRPATFGSAPQAPPPAPMPPRRTNEVIGLFPESGGRP